MSATLEKHLLLHSLRIWHVWIHQSLSSALKRDHLVMISRSKNDWFCLFCGNYVRMALNCIRGNTSNITKELSISKAPEKERIWVSLNATHHHQKTTNILHILLLSNVGAIPILIENIYHQWKFVTLIELHQSNERITIAKIFAWLQCEVE